MHILKWPVRLLALLGFVLAFILAYFAFNPKSVSAQTDIQLSSILNCSSQEFKLAESLNVNGQKIDTSNINLDEIKNLFKDQIPAETLQQFENNTDLGNNLDNLNNLKNVVDKLANTFGSAATTNVTYCTINENSESTMKKVEDYFKTKEKFFNYGKADDIMNQVNKIPFLKISLPTLEVPSTIARTTYCNKPITKSDYYLFTFVENNSSTNVVMYSLKVNEKESESDPKNRYVNNLIETGQYYKSNFYCNGQ